MNRRRILTGLVAAPFVARLGILMPVRPVLASGGIVEVKWWLLPAYSSPSYGPELKRLIAMASRVCAVPPEQLVCTITNRSTLALSSLRQPACGDPTCVEAFPY